ncbi:nipped-B-like protein A [Cynoglossus semilaevis]|uniref:nipped-B-like protein A n=1 Tax=Cynoglossus semilaevis TaxID=244447 RepID=UPI000D626A4E|nr:nipped-B-like protein A [Cynoglossus semilaevis]
MHPSQMFMPEVKTLYSGILVDSSSSINLKIQILKNLQTYLQEEDTRMQEADREYHHQRFQTRPLHYDPGNLQHCRAFLISLHLFDDSAKTEVNMLLFIADNLACFPYQSQEEPLFIMHHIDISLSVSGSNLLQTFRELLLKEPRKKEKKVKREWKSTSDGEDEEEKLNCDSPRSSDEEHRNRREDGENDDENVVRRPKNSKKPIDSSEFYN